MISTRRNIMNDKLDPKKVKELSKQRYNELQEKKDEKLIPNLERFNKAFDEIFK